MLLLKNSEAALEVGVDEVFRGGDFCEEYLRWDKAFT